MTVAKNQAYEQTNTDTREGANLLTTKEIGTTGGARQIGPETSFHPAYINSQTQNSCVINMTNSSTKDAAIPGCKD